MILHFLHITCHISCITYITHLPVNNPSIYIHTQKMFMIHRFATLLFSQYFRSRPIQTEELEKSRMSREREPSDISGV